MSAPEIPGYRELRELGRGGGGRVVLAEHLPTGTWVAVKHLSERLAAEPEFVAAFRHEARLLAELDTPHVVRLYEYLESPHGKAIVMEYVDGVSLRALLADGAPVPPEAALAVLHGALSGLAVAHARGVVHRDFKPDNVLVAKSGASKLADFGIAARSGQAGPAMGTPKYTAPEQWAGAVAGPAGDLYAATAVFFECITGTPPFRGQDTEALRWQHDQAPVPLERVPERLRPLVARGLAKSPSGRPADATQFLDELRRAASAACGPDWERRGRDLLAEAALLLMLRHAPARQPVTSSSVARTTLNQVGSAPFGPAAVGSAPILSAQNLPRRFRHPRRVATTAAAGLAVTVAVALMMGSGKPRSAPADASSDLASQSPGTSSTPPEGAPGPSRNDPQTSATAAGAPASSGGFPSSVSFSATTTGSAPSSSPARKPTGPATPRSSSRSSAPPASASSPTGPSGPLPAKVLAVTAALAADPGPGTAPVRATVTVTTADTSAVTLTLCYAADLGTTAGPPWDVGPSCDAPRTLQGDTTYTVSEVYDLPRNCYYPYVQVAATTGPAAPAGPAVASFNDADCIF